MGWPLYNFDVPKYTVLTGGCLTLAIPHRGDVRALTRASRADRRRPIVARELVVDQDGERTIAWTHSTFQDLASAVTERNRDDPATHLNHRPPEQSCGQLSKEAWVDPAPFVVPPTEPEPSESSVVEQFRALVQQATRGASLEVTLAELVTGTATILKPLAVSLLLAGNGGDVTSRFLAIRLRGQPRWESHPRAWLRDLALTILRSGRTVTIPPDETARATRRSRQSPVGSVVGIPIRYGDECLGVLILEFEAEHVRSPAERALGEAIAAYAALAIALDRSGAAEQSARQALEDAQQQLRRIAEIIAQALREPLVAVVTSVEIIRESRFHEWSDLRRRLIPAIEKATTRLQQLADELLHASRIMSDRFTIAPFSVDLIEVARRAVEQQQAGTELHQIRLVGPDQLRGIWDHQHLFDMLSALISNAIAYSPGGGEIRIAIERRGDEAIISVSDQGIGIPAEELPFLFQPFSRIRNPPGRGAGLGLYVARAIAEAHAGRIWVESRQRRGSTFSVALPIKSDYRSEVSDEGDRKGDGIDG